MIEKEGQESPAALARIRRILMVSRCELILLVGVVWNMVVKPVGQGGWFWGAFVVMVLGVAAVIANWSRAESRVPRACDRLSYSESSTRRAPAATAAPSSTWTARTTAS